MTRRLTAPFAALFNPVVVVAVLAAFVAITWWVLFDKGLASAAHEAFHKPGLLLLVFVVTVLSAGFHEFGHAAAARYGGATPGAMGVGLYLVWPAFYTDVTDTYRLGRGGRVRTDLGGLYFNAIVAVGVVGVWWADRVRRACCWSWPPRSCRWSGSCCRWSASTATTCSPTSPASPTSTSRIRPTLLGVLPWRWRDPEAPALKPWARVVVTLWVLVVVPLLALSRAADGADAARGSWPPPG